MKEEIYNEQELKAIEDEIRAFGIPYCQNEPDDRYFANFRVHLMERIEEKEAKKSIFASVLSWLTTSPLRSLSLCAGVATVIVAALLINPTQEPKITYVQQAPVVIAPQPIALQEIKQNIAEAPKVIAIAKPKIVKNTTLAAKTNTDRSLEAAISASDLASVLTSSESDGPVNYENLSESDLESVVKIAEEMN